MIEGAASTGARLIAEDLGCIPEYVPPSLERMGVPSEQHIIESNHAGDVIVACASALDATFVALGTRGAGVAPSTVGGVAAHVIRHSTVPVLVHR